MLEQVKRVFDELDQGKWKPFYLLAGEESFQTGLIVERLKQFFCPDDSTREFNFESWDGESLDPAALLRSLDTMPGLFAGPDTVRLVLCTNFDRASSTAETLASYFAAPSASTCLVMVCPKVDKRKSWVRQVQENGFVIELAEPYDRDWPKWHSYFERKSGKKIDSEAWEILVEGSGRSLSLVWSELQKLQTYVGTRDSIVRDDVICCIAVSGADNIFEFVDDVMSRRAAPAIRKFNELVRGGESEIKIVSLLVRQFRLVDHCLRLKESGVVDRKAVAAQVGVHPFFVPNLMRQLLHQSPTTISWALANLSDCDFRLKTGEGGLFQDFLVPYFSRARQG